jgi:hypothetical protein
VVVAFVVMLLWVWSSFSLLSSQVSMTRPTGKMAKLNRQRAEVIRRQAEQIRQKPPEE